MKIGIYHQNVSRVGGSVSTMLQFADCFKQLGHKVKFHSTFKNTILKNKKDVLSFYDCKYLNMNDFVWNLNMIDYDLCFSRGVYQDQFKCKHIIWAIVPNEIDKENKNNNLVEYWTNSNTIKHKLFDNHIFPVEVIPAPHDYSLFRNNISNEKKYDIVSILRWNDFEMKGIPLYVDIVKQLNCKSLLITTCNSEKDFKKIKKLKIPYVCNKSREQVSKILGQSKMLFFPSYDESCPLIIYEAMNSGLTIVSRNVGAVKEQLSNVGYIFNKDKKSLDLVKYGLNNLIDKDKVLKRGLIFDRKNVLNKIEEKLNKI